MSGRLPGRWMAGLAVIAGSLWATTMASRAQEGDILLVPPPTVVTIAAADAVATEPPRDHTSDGTLTELDPAVFVVHRDANLHIDLTVYYQVGGTAANGEDYAELSGKVVIPAGHRAARIVVKPLADGIEEGRETVQLTLVPPVCIAIFPPPPECYQVGRPSEATAVIRDREDVDVNYPPHVEITRPVDGASLSAGEPITVNVVTRDRDGYAPRVVLFADGVRVAQQEIVFIQPPPDGDPIHFELVWTNALPGRHVLRALAFDNEGAEGWSDPVRVVVELDFIFPEVNVVATDPEAAEPDPVPEGMLRPIVLDTGTFTVTRKGGDLGLPLRVFYMLTGTAENGVDYEELMGSVEIPAEASSATVEVLPIDDELHEGRETVVLTLIPPPIFVEPVLLEAETELYTRAHYYRIGNHDRDVVYILDNDVDGDFPPRVAIVRPTSGSLFEAPANIHLVAHAADRDGEVVQVEFFAGERSLGIATAEGSIDHFLEGDLFHLLWADVPAGSYRLSAVATDNDGLMSRSEPVYIKVVEEPPPPDDPPVVNIRTIDPVGSENESFGGTPTLSFRVMRHGNTNDSLRVYYDIGGTATNGEDYERLPSSVLIPAGYRAAHIVVRPIDDDIDERPESVVLSLVLPPHTDHATDPAPYRIGRSARAAGLIIDHDRPRPRCMRLDDGTFHLCHDGEGSHCFRIEASDDLRHWHKLTDQPVADGALHFVDPDGGWHQRRFYRVIPVPCPEL